MVGLYQADVETEAILMIGEIGGTVEEDAAFSLQAAGGIPPAIRSERF